MIERGLGPIIPTGCSPPSPRQRRISPPSFARLAMPRKRVVLELPGKTRVLARLIFEESCRSLNLHRLSELRYSLERNQQPERVKSTGPVALHARPAVCVVLRLAYDPLPIPGGLLPRRNLRRHSGIFPHVADREPLDLNSLLRLLRSHLECIRFRPTRQVVSWRIGSPRYLTPRAWPQLARLPHLPTLLQTVALPVNQKPSWANVVHQTCDRRSDFRALPEASSVQPSKVRPTRSCT